MKRGGIVSKVSVIVPIYNAGPKLHKCIKSVLSQTYKDFELILVNDGSTDNSLDICYMYKRKDKRIIVIDKENEGSIATLRRGVSTARNNYIMFVDQDDWIDVENLEVLYKNALETDADITVCNIYKTIGGFFPIRKTKKNEYLDGERLYKEDAIKNELVVAYLHGHPFPAFYFAKLYKKDLLTSSGNFLDKISFFGNDVFYNIEMLLKAKKVKTINKPLYYYRIGGFTSKFMPYLFVDMINGYLIQKEVIIEHYQNSEIHFNGISIMLLNTFKTCLYNLHNGNFKHYEIRRKIKEYVNHQVVKECLQNEGSKSYFPEEYLNAIQNKDIDYLYEVGKNLYNKRIFKNLMLRAYTKLSFNN